MTKDRVKIPYAATNKSVPKEDYFEIKIDQITNDHVQGTFSGTLIRYEDGVTLEKIPISNGKFNLTVEPSK
ncbi:hypothetical protein ACP6L2_00920 [Sphingobacterium lactis]|uniref:hypothetical protein n=1 Tax=Sphingobacterium lactis TaxID=797291 RepID=UPI003F7D5CEE